MSSPSFGDNPVQPLITEDLPCIHCRYNLRGLDETGVCPECGSRIEPSLANHRQAADLLDRVDPKWVKRLGGAFILLAFAGAWALFSIIADEYVRRLYYSHPRHTVHAIRLGLLAVPWAFSVIAARWIGSREPHATTPDNPIARWGIRSCAILWLLAPVLINRPAGYRINWFQLLAVAAAANLLMFWRAAKLAARIPKPRLATECLILAVGLGATSLFQVVSIGPSMLRWGSADEIFIAAPMLGILSPVLAAQMPDAVRHTLRTGRFDFEHCIVTLAAAGALWSIVTLVRLGIAMRRIAGAHTLNPN